MRHIISIVLVFVLGSPSFAVAQARGTDWSKVGTIPSGSRLLVELSNGKKTNGTLQNALENQIVVSGETINRDDVRRIYLVGGRRLGRSVAIGAGIGAAAGTITGVA